jgi:hypothetical protein
MQSRGCEEAWISEMPHAVRVAAPRLPFAELFGARLGEPDACVGMPVSLRDGGTLTGVWQRDSISPVSAEVLGAFPNGSPAVTANRFRKDTALQIGTLHSLRYHQARDDTSRRAIGAPLGPPPAARPASTGHPGAFIGGGRLTRRNMHTRISASIASMGAGHTAAQPRTDRLPAFAGRVGSRHPYRPAQRRAIASTKTGQVTTCGSGPLHAWRQTRNEKKCRCPSFVFPAPFGPRNPNTSP